MYTLTMTIEAYHQGTNLGRLEGLRLIVEAMGGKVESVTAKPTDEEWWRLDIAVLVPPERKQRCEQVAEKLFDGAVNVIVTGSRETDEE